MKWRKEEASKTSSRKTPDMCVTSLLRHFLAFAIIKNMRPIQPSDRQIKRLNIVTWVSKTAS